MQSQSADNCSMFISDVIVQTLEVKVPHQQDQGKIILKFLGGEFTTTKSKTSHCHL